MQPVLTMLRRVDQEGDSPVKSSRLWALYLFDWDRLCWRSDSTFEAGVRMQGKAGHIVGRAFRNPHSLAPLVMAMGFIGASLRYVLEMALPADGGFPFATLAVNIFGCFVLEIINEHIAVRTQLPSMLVKSMGVGLIGAFTTVAAFSTESLSFLQSGRYGVFALYLLTTVVVTFAAAWVGKLVADRLGMRMRGAQEAHVAMQDDTAAKKGAGE